MAFLIDTNIAIHLRDGTEAVLDKFAALQMVDVPEPVPGAGEILVRTTASVLNYNEVDGCRGRYLTINPPIPYTLGMEVVGEVEAAGPGAERWLGRRVIACARGASSSGDNITIPEMTIP